MLALIDGDIIIYRIGFTTQTEEEWVAKARCDDMMDAIIQETEASEYQVWLSDKTENNFRTKIYPEYKANRKDFVKPVHYDFLRNYLVDHWGASLAIEQEADDALGIEQTKYNKMLEDPEYGDNGSCICSIDKDLLQIPGSHYNFVKKEKTFVSPEDGLKFFYRQLITGDTADNIQGCPKIGPVKAAACLKGATDELDLFNRCASCYRSSYAKYIFQCKPEELSSDQEKIIHDQLLINGQCLKIRQYEGEIWSFPVI